MWKHFSVFVASSFDGAWGDVPNIEGALQLSQRLPSRVQALSRSLGGLPPGVEVRDMTAGELPGVGVTGTFSVVASDPAAFYADDTANQETLEGFLAGFAMVPHSNVDVTIPPAPTAGAGAPAPIPITYVVTLPPGPTEISGRLSRTSPADVLSAFQGQLGAGLVNSASVTMTGAAGTVAGNFLLATTDTSLTGIRSVAHEHSIRVAIAQLAGVYIGDVSPITFASSDGAVLEAEPETLGPNTVLNGRRLTAGTVNAAFTIAVPGAAAGTPRGYHKDCSLLNIRVPAMDNVGDLENTLTTIIDATSSNVGEPMTEVGCSNEATRRGAEVRSFIPSDPDRRSAFGVGQCIISDWSHIEEATYQAGVTIHFRGEDAACGDCPAAPPAAGSWPGVDSAASNNAFGGHQPLNLQCWPKDYRSAPMPCGYQVVESSATAAGWPGCNNLNRHVGTQDSDACRRTCQNDLFCATWIWADSGSLFDDCYTGVGNQCDGNNHDVILAERLQHGMVNVIVDNFTSGVVAGLQQQFGENVQVVGLAGNATAQSETCRKICHSNIMCTFWQSFYRTGTGSDLGCWIENPGVDLGGLVQYPFTTSGFANDGDVDALTGGQFIQHHCPIPTLPSRPPTTQTAATPTALVAVAPVPPVVTPVPPAPAAGSFWNPWGYVLMGGLLLGLVAVVLVMLGNQKPKKPSGTRAVKPVKKKENQPPAAPPQPVVPLMAPQFMVQPTIPQPLTTIQQPNRGVVAAQAVVQPVAQFGAQPNYPQFVQRPY